MLPSWAATPIVGVMTEPLHPVIRRYYEAYNARRFQEAASLFAPNAVIEHAPYDRPQPRGGTGYLKSAERSIVAFPDAQIDILGVKAHDDRIFEVELIASGTHLGTLDLGSYGRFEPAGVVVHVRHREVLEIRDGLILYASLTLDVNDLLTQLRGRA
jgi:predicted ester cyclase